MSRTTLIVVVAVLLYFLWRRRSSAIAAGNEWQDYAPSKFRVIDGGQSIVAGDDK